MCGNARYKVPVLQGGTGCKKEFYDKLSIEMNTFYDQFRQNRGDKALWKWVVIKRQHMIF